MAYREVKLVVSSHVSVLEASRRLNCAALGNSIAMDFQTQVLVSCGQVTKGITYFDIYCEHEVIRYLIGRRVDIDGRTFSGETAPHVAVRNNDARGVQIVRDVGVRPDTANMAGRSAFDIAVSENKLGAVAVLQEHRGSNL
ncbi:hypothetical protein DL768_004625 [Monosporascus sp. mg162]|nr:hypothetical protein DL768_004625 [Monosporascus sp. mg162]